MLHSNYRLILVQKCFVQYVMILNLLLLNLFIILLDQSQLVQQVLDSFVSELQSFNETLWLMKFVNVFTKSATSTNQSTAFKILLEMMVQKCNIQSEPMLDQVLQFNQRCLGLIGDEALQGLWYITSSIMQGEQYVLDIDRLDHLINHSKIYQLSIASLLREVNVRHLSQLLYQIFAYVITQLKSSQQFGSFLSQIYPQLINRLHMGFALQNDGSDMDRSLLGTIYNFFRLSKAILDGYSTGFLLQNSIFQEYIQLSTNQLQVNPEGRTKCLILQTFSKIMVDFTDMYSNSNPVIKLLASQIVSKDSGIKGLAQQFELQFLYFIDQSLLTIVAGIRSMISQGPIPQNVEIKSLIAQLGNLVLLLAAVGFREKLGIYLLQALPTQQAIGYILELSDAVLISYMYILQKYIQSSIILQINRYHPYHYIKMHLMQVQNTLTQMQRALNQIQQQQV